METALSWGKAANCGSKPYSLLDFRFREVQGVPSIPVISMNALISACGRGRRPDLALAIFNDMQ